MVLQIVLSASPKRLSQGPSGAGKTLLLDALARRTNSGIVYGQILVNGQSHKRSADNLSATVYQHDVQFLGATVKEALIFSALLRQPKTVPCIEKITYAERVLNLIGMEAFADTVIGNSGERTY